MKRSILLSVILIMGIGFTSASDTPTEGIWDFNNYIARTAKSRYDFEIGRIKRIYDFEVNKAKRIYDSVVDKLTLTKNTETQIAQKELLSKLDEVMITETKAGRLDEALKIKKAIEEVRSGKGIPVKEDKPTKKNIPSCAVEYDGHHYLAVLRPVSWKEAKKLCEDMGGHLVYIESDNEIKLLKKLTSNRAVWVGATITDGNANDPNNWKWMNGKDVNKKLWIKGQPNNRKTLEYYAVLHSNAEIFKTTDDGYGLTSVNNNKSWVKGFICEWE